MKRIILMASIALSLTGCMTYNLQNYGQIDQSNKSITVPPGSSGLTGRLKQALKNDGWSLAVRRGPRVTEGSFGEKTRLEQYDTFNTRYELVMNWNQFDFCVPGFTPALYYDISMIDNKSGAEVFALGGRGCEPEVAEKFIEAIRGTK